MIPSNVTRALAVALPSTLGLARDRVIREGIRPLSASEDAMAVVQPEPPATDTEPPPPPPPRRRSWVQKFHAAFRGCTGEQRARGGVSAHRQLGHTQREQRRPRSGVLQSSGRRPAHRNPGRIVWPGTDHHGTARRTRPRTGGSVCPRKVSFPTDGSFRNRQPACHFGDRGRTLLAGLRGPTDDPGRRAARFQDPGRR